MNVDIQLKIREVAEQAVCWYVQDIPMLPTLEERLTGEWEKRQSGEECPSYAVLMRIAQRLCSRELYFAWQSPDMELRNVAFNNIRRYLERSLRHTRYTALLQDYACTAEDVLHQTLEMLHLALMRHEHAGPDDPSAFLKWMQTILFRQARVCLQHRQRDCCLSLEALAATGGERFVDESNSDPLDYVLLKEVQQTLGRAILSVRNQRYRQVLIYTYIAGVDERELAHALQVRVQDIYLWRHRALKALRDKAETMSVLRSS